MSRITKSAKGEDCQVRLPGICNHNPETTVFAHYRMNTGLGIKPSDLHGAYACSSCHDEIDRRTQIYKLYIVRMAHLEGMIRTQLKLIEKGLIKLE